MKYKNIHRDIAVLLVMLLTIATSYAFDGSGTAEDPWLIQTEEDLRLLSVEGTAWWKSYKLTADLDMAGVEFYGIGDGANGAGTTRGITFDGDGHIISNLTIISRGSDGVGFFNHIGWGLTVKNLGFFALTVNASGQNGVGGILGDAQAWNQGEISNCFVTKGKITGKSHVGGIIGQGRAMPIVNCHVKATIVAKDVGGYAGGIIGSADEWGAGETPVTNVMFYGSVNNSGGADANAIVGYPGADTLPSITNAYFDATGGALADTFAVGVTMLEDTNSYPGLIFGDSTWIIQPGVGAVLGFNPPWVASVAVASEDQYAKEGDYLTVSGTYSTPSTDGDAVQYYWSYEPDTLSVNFTYRRVYREWDVEGEIIIYDTTKQDSATFQVPVFPGGDDTLTIILDVIDDFGVQSPESDTVLIFVRTAASNIAPTADAGDDQIVQFGRNVTIAGSAYDADGDSISYSWSIPSMFPQLDSTSPTLKFIAPSIPNDTTYAFKLRTYDDAFNAQSDSSMVYITVIANVAPEATTTVAQATVSSTDLVFLDTIDVYDANGDEVFYSWRGPEGIKISDTSIAKPTFTAPNVSEVTDFVVTLVVNDGFLESNPSSVTITVSPNDRMYPPTLGIDENTLSDISVYPNPSTGIVTIDMARSSEITIANVLGKTVYKELLTEGKNVIDLSRLSRGVYLVWVNSENSKTLTKLQIR